MWFRHGAREAKAAKIGFFLGACILAVVVLLDSTAHVDYPPVDSPKAVLQSQTDLANCPCFITAVDRWSGGKYITFHFTVEENNGRINLTRVERINVDDREEKIERTANDKWYDRFVEAFLSMKHIIRPIRRHNSRDAHRMAGKKGENYAIFAA